MTQQQRVRIPLPYALSAEQAASVFDAVGRPWVWFDGAGASAGEPRVSRLGISDEALVAVPGQEPQFLNSLSQRLSQTYTGARAETPFASGWAVVLSYEFGRGLLGFDTRGGDAHGAHLFGAAPHGIALRIPVVLSINHEDESAEITGPPEQVDAWLRSYGDGCAAAAAASSEASTASEHGHRGQQRRQHSKVHTYVSDWRLSGGQYRAAVTQCREHIREGDAYVLCLTDTATVPTTMSPLTAMRELRAHRSALRAGLISGTEWALVSASPERFVSVRDRIVTTHPMKGTRPRAEHPREDRRLAHDLQTDAKERAENLMIVDLMRNDLHRVCEPDTVTVENFLTVETHAEVHQLVSSVTGKLQVGRNICDVIAALFPGGSMTGAPKHRAVELLTRLEGGPRGLYAGTFGWIDDSGDSEFAMTIRSIEFDLTSGVARVGSGGGVTADSDPEREFAEKELKAAALLAVLTGEPAA